MRISTQTQAEAALTEIRRLREDLAAVRQAQNNLTFQVTNISVDEKANNPLHRIYYYDAVDQGRVAITALQNQTNIYPRLHFRTEGGWVVTRSVRAARPRGITQAAQEMLPGALSEARASIAGVSDPALAMGQLFEAYKSTVLRIYGVAVIDQTIEHDTKGRFYNVESVPLAHGFRIVQNGQIEDLA